MEDGSVAAMAQAAAKAGMMVAAKAAGWAVAMVGVRAAVGNGVAQRAATTVELDMVDGCIHTNRHQYTLLDLWG